MRFAAYGLTTVEKADLELRGGDFSNLEGTEVVQVQSRVKFPYSARLEYSSVGKIRDKNPWTGSREDMESLQKVHLTGHLVEAGS